MTEKKAKKTLDDLIFMDKKGLGDLLDQAAKLRGGKLPWHRCNICDDPYLETELTDDEEVGYICEGCARSKKELDDEQEETEKMREKKELRDDEMKIKAGYFDKEGP